MNTNKTNNMRKLFSIAVLALTLAACTSDDESISQSTVDEGVKGIPFSATISARHATRAITENNDVLETAWADNEQVALIHNNNVYVMSVTANNDGTATISGTIEGSPKDGDDVTIVYPASAVDQTTLKVKADLLAKQDGTLATIAQSLDLRQSSGAKLKVAASSASLDGTVTLENQVAIVKFSLSDGTNAINATKFLIKDVNGNVLTTVEPSAAASILYVAMSPATTSAFLFEAIVGSDTYSYAVSAATLTAGMYYQSPLTMKLPATYRIFDALGAPTDKVIPADAQTLTGAVTLNNLAAGTYVVEGTATYSGNLKLAGDVNLILLDGASLTVNGIILGGERTDDPFNYNLTIYGQELGTGTLTATGEYGVMVQNLTVHGGVITATGTDAIGDGINTSEKVTVYGGEISVTGGLNGHGILAQDGFVLGAGYTLYEGTAANSMTEVTNPTNITQRYAAIKCSAGGII